MNANKRQKKRRRLNQLVEEKRDKTEKGAGRNED